MKGQAHRSQKFIFIKPLIHMVYQSRCIICGNISVNNHVHHVDWDNKNNNAFNLIVVCKEHHIQLHQNKFKLSKELTTEQYFFLSEIENYTNLLNFKT